ncbi:MAG: hypothetical protein JHC39_05650 [Lentimicrobium sp.]|jgi:hypothetical protein|nr:hypothetical protein [Lentimicrobium sp.]
MKSKIFPVISILFLLFVSCTNDSESDLMNPNSPATITYTNSIKSIIDNNCIFCHGTIPSNGAPMSLTTYQTVKDAVLNRGLIDRISRAQDAAGMMPYGGSRLPQSNIDQVITWKNTGFTE